MTARRTLQQRGWVNFPTETMESSNEGGMYVQLVVAPRGNHWDRDPWMLCSNALPEVPRSESLIHDGVHETPEIPEPPEGSPPEVWREWTEKLCQPSEAVHFHYPDAYRSIPYLAVITLGSTGWSNGDWHCTRDDLTLEGRALYQLMQDLYADKGDVYLMTWLDT